MVSGFEIVLKLGIFPSLPVSVCSFSLGFRFLSMSLLLITPCPVSQGWFEQLAHVDLLASLADGSLR